MHYTATKDIWCDTNITGFFFVNILRAWTLLLNRYSHKPTTCILTKPTTCIDQKKAYHVNSLQPHNFQSTPQMAGNVTFFFLYKAGNITTRSKDDENQIYRTKE